MRGVPTLRQCAIRRAKFCTSASRCGGVWYGGPWPLVIELTISIMIKAHFLGSNSNGSAIVFLQNGRGLRAPRYRLAALCSQLAAHYAGSASTLLISLNSRQSLRQVSPPSSLRYRYP